MLVLFINAYCSIIEDSFYTFLQEHEDYFCLQFKKIIKINN